MKQVSGIQLYIQKAQYYSNKALAFVLTFVKNPNNQVIVALLFIALMLFLISKKESFMDMYKETFMNMNKESFVDMNTEYMYLKDKDEYLCCDMTFTKDKNNADKVKVIKTDNNTVNIQFDNKDKHYLGVNDKGNFTVAPLCENCSYGFIFQDNLIRLENTGEYASRRGDALEVVSTKDRALHLTAE